MGKNKLHIEWNKMLILLSAAGDLRFDALLLRARCPLGRMQNASQQITGYKTTHLKKIQNCPPRRTADRGRLNELIKASRYREGELGPADLSTLTAERPIRTS